jgi:hypothetical protein
MLSYGVDVTSIDWTALRRASVEYAEDRGVAVRVRLALERQGIPTCLDIHLDDDARQAADAAVDMMGRLRASANAPAWPQGHRERGPDD